MLSSSPPALALALCRRKDEVPCPEVPGLQGPRAVGVVSEGQRRRRVHRVLQAVQVQGAPQRLHTMVVLNSDFQILNAPRARVNGNTRYTL